ncbi:hypothetical protein BV20DRAFT_964390 [Pilatotrama ljubarskyi]|nr:hypothetical protein BV20DRAFT_964390 [Pilatotrama ljubarskyi]
MSLSSFLLPADKGKVKEIDKGLDDLFRSSTVVAPARPTVTATPAPAASTTPAASFEKKRKATEQTPNGKAKRSKPDATTTPSSSKSLAKTGKKAKKPVESSSESEEDEDAKLQERMQKKGKSAKKADAEEAESSSSSDSDSDDEGDPSKLVHESLLKGGQSKGQSRNGKTKYVPEEESPEQRDARTVFVGNVAVEVTKSRPTQKQFKRHLLSFVPSAKIESIRFRSVAFKKPTAELTHDDDGKPKKTRAHDRERAATWRADQNNDDPDAEADPRKSYLTPKEKKRIAFIKHEIHENIDSVNAYVVFAHAPPAENRPANLPPPPPVMNPYEAAAECAKLCDGSVFLGRTLRVDVVKKDASPGAGRSGSGMTGDPKATLFVGNLDFASKEEDLRAFFESVVRQERGEPGERAEGESSGSEEEDEAEERARTGAQRPRTWVKRVRIIRDRDTQLGKGFAYVQFVDRECVDEILALEEGKLKFAKRKLRVQRCKTLPGGPKLTAAKAIRGAASSSKSRPGALASQAGRPNAGSSSSRPKSFPLVPARVPKGNPELGAKLAHLPKEERKRAKATDPDRVARRLAKKRAKALAEKGVKARGGEKERERVRKPRSEKNAGGREKEKGKPKKRVRSGKAMAKLNTKK